jgi:5-methyltetrahydropteroyltriglutamate--homocysteine methyltransferase
MPKRILATHVGSLPKSDAALMALGANPKEDQAAIRENILKVVGKQIEVGLDIVNDGEAGRRSFIGYVSERLSGFEPEKSMSPPTWIGSRDAKAFPDYYATHGGPSFLKSRCTGAITYTGRDKISEDIKNLQTAVGGADIAGIFLAAPSPGSIQGFWQTNEFYATAEEYLYALADAMRHEYKAILDAGLILQIDDPHIFTHYVRHPELSLEDCRRQASTRIKALNHSLHGLPQDRIRHHTCYGINVGPRVHDMEMKFALDLILTVNANTYSFEAANPRHEHEWRLWEDVRLPEGKALMPGVITNSSVLVEHPELVSQRLVRFANLVGRENVIAGADCGFASSGSPDDIPEDVVWAKMRALVEGSRIATKTLWQA